MSDERRKKSWREIDSARDRSKRPEPGSGVGRSKRQDHASKQYRSALDALFEKGGFGKVAEVLGHAEKAKEPAGGEDEVRLVQRKKIVDAIGREEISRAVNKYLSKWGWPSDWEVLEQALDHTDEARVEEALGKIEEMVAKERPRRARTLIGKLRFLEETAAVPEVRAHAAALRAELG